jgi:UDP-glucose 4-epimerase
MRILITGGAGFIGSSLTDLLITKGHEILIIDNFETGRRNNVHKDATLIIDTIANKDTVSNIFNQFKPEIVVHAAASYKDPENWYGDSNTNVVGAVNIVKECVNHKVKKIIYFQTSLCYGHPRTNPITLDHQIDPCNSYAISKTAAEQYIKMSGIDYVSFRLANAYGPRNLSGPPPTFFSRLNNNQDCFVVNTRRDFIFIDDLINIVNMAIDGVGHGCYHVSTGRDYSIKEIYETVAKIMNISKSAIEKQRNDDDVESILLDPSETLKTFNFIPNYPLQMGLERAIEWYRNNSVTQTYTHLKGFENK